MSNTLRHQATRHKEYLTKNNARFELWGTRNFFQNQGDTAVEVDGVILMPLDSVEFNIEAPYYIRDRIEVKFMTDVIPMTGMGTRATVATEAGNKLFYRASRITVQFDEK